MVYVYDCLFWAHSQSDIDNVMNSFKEDGPIYTWGHSEVESVSNILGIDLKTLYDSLSQFYQTGLIFKVLEAMLRHLLGQTIMVMRLREIVPTCTLLL